MVERGDAAMGGQAGLVLAAGLDPDDDKTLRGLRVDSDKNVLRVCLYVWNTGLGEWVKMTQP